MTQDKTERPLTPSERQELDRLVALVVLPETFTAREREVAVAVARPLIDRVQALEALLRSACTIAERRGEGTAWERFIESVFALGLNGVTARTYRVLPSDRAALVAEEPPR